MSVPTQPGPDSSRRAPDDPRRLRTVRFPPKAWRQILAGFMAVLGLINCTGAAPVSEYEVKAAFLYNFIQFVEWPKAALPENQPFVIGVLGRDPFGSRLDELVAGESHQGRPIVVRRFREPAEIDSCHLLFISARESAELEGLLTPLRGRPILTVGEAPGFLSAGGMVRFVLRDNRVRLQIGAEAAKAARLEVSSKLLRLAEK